MMPSQRSRARSRVGMSVLAVCTVGLSGCLFMPGRDDVVTPVPDEWDIPPPSAADVWPATDWWENFTSPELDGLIAEAQASNLDIAAAAARLVQAEGQARIAGVVLLPTLEAGFGTSRSGVFSEGDAERSHSASVSASYELDFWGANRADLRAAQASLRSSRYDQQTVALTTTTGVANTYLQILSLRERLVTARQNLEIAERVLGIVQARVRTGATTRLDLAQQLGTVAAQRALIPSLEQQERDARTALAILLGRLPQDFDVTAQNLDALAVPEVAPGLPSDLLARRPDVRSAEAQLVAADANLAAARAAMFPSIRLTASSGVQSGLVDTLFDDNPAFTLALALSRPIFDAGRLSAQRGVAEARRVELIQSYRSTVITAFSDVETALGGLDSIVRQQEQQDIALEQAQIALEVAEARYRAGAVDLLTLLDAQRTLYSAQDESRQLRLGRLQSVVTLYRVLGGGWQDTAT